jgi:hypothetical protein
MKLLKSIRLVFLGKETWLRFRIDRDWYYTQDMADLWNAWSSNHGLRGEASWEREMKLRKINEKLDERK